MTVPWSIHSGPKVIPGAGIAGELNPPTRPCGILFRVADLFAVLASLWAELWVPGPGKTRRRALLILLVIVPVGAFTWAALYFDVI